MDGYSPTHLNRFYSSYLRKESRFNAVPSDLNKEIASYLVAEEVLSFREESETVANDLLPLTTEIYKGRIKPILKHTLFSGGITGLIIWGRTVGCPSVWMGIFWSAVLEILAKMEMDPIQVTRSRSMKFNVMTIVPLLLILGFMYYKEGMSLAKATLQLCSDMGITGFMMRVDSQVQKMKCSSFSVVVGSSIGVSVGELMLQLDNDNFAVVAGAMIVAVFATHYLTLFK